MNTSSTPSPSRTTLVLAFAAIYVVWGSTYLAIRVVVETLPPFSAAGVRFLIAGGLLYAFLRLRGGAKSSTVQWRHSAVAGGLLLVGGNGLVMWAEQHLSSGFTALLIALTPVWFAVLDWLRPGGVRPQARTVVGIIIGFLGVIILVQSRTGAAHGPMDGWGAAALIAAGAAWAGGSLYAKHSPNTASPWMNAASQMICGGAGLLLVGTLLGGIAAYARGKLEEVIMRITDLVFCFPPIILALAIAAALEPRPRSSGMRFTKLKR